MTTGVSDNMRYRVSPTKRKRCRSRSSDQSNMQLPGFYDDQAAVLLNVKVIDNTPPAPARNSSLNRFQMIIAQQQKLQVTFAMRFYVDLPATRLGR